VRTHAQGADAVRGRVQHARGAAQQLAQPNGPYTAFIPAAAGHHAGVLSARQHACVAARDDSTSAEEETAAAVAGRSSNGARKVNGEARVRLQAQALRIHPALP